MGIVSSSVVTAVGCLAIAFIFGWKLALLILVFVPFVLFGAIMETKMYMDGNSGNLVNSEEAGKVRSIILIMLSFMG